MQDMDVASVDENTHLNIHDWPKTQFAQANVFVGTNNLVKNCGENCHDIFSLTGYMKI